MTIVEHVAGERAHCHNRDRVRCVVVGVGDRTTGMGSGTSHDAALHQGGLYTSMQRRGSRATHTWTSFVPTSHYYNPAL
jgi:hypothetical protein